LRPQTSEIRLVEGEHEGGAVALIDTTYFFFPAGARFLSGDCVSTDPASFFAASVDDFCFSTLPARLASSLDDFSFLAMGHSV
jgi:hypothetical protein